MRSWIRLSSLRGTVFDVVHNFLVAAEGVDQKAIEYVYFRVGVVQRETDLFCQKYFLELLTGDKEVCHDKFVGHFNRLAKF